MPTFVSISGGDALAERIGAMEVNSTRKNSYAPSRIYIGGLKAHAA